MTDLSSATIEEIWEEIRQRTDAAVLISLIHLDDEEEERLFFYHGGVTAIGLAHLADRRLLDNYLATGRNAEGEE